MVAPATAGDDGNNNNTARHSGPEASPSLPAVKGAPPGSGRVVSEGGVGGDRAGSSGGDGSGGIDGGGARLGRTMVDTKDSNSGNERGGEEEEEVKIGLCCVLNWAVRVWCACTLCGLR